MPHRQNTVHVTYRLLDGAGTVALELRPSVHFRGYEDRVDARASPATTATRSPRPADRYELSRRAATLPPLRLQVDRRDGTRLHRRRAA